jgi:hypothetical protein
VPYPTTTAGNIQLNYPIVFSPTSFIFPPTTSMNLNIPFDPSKEFFNSLNKSTKTLRCYPTNEALKPLIGIENWCLQLCAINCSPTLCICVQI